MKKILLSMLLVISSGTHAADQWAKGKVYTAGDTVEWNDELFISSHWTQGTEPQVNDINWDGWIYIDQERITSWNNEAVYTGGDIVNINDQYYLSNWWNTNEYPENASSWRHLKELDFDTPPPKPDPDEDNTIEGIDADDNGIRDDYERIVLEKYDDPELINIAISASQEWKKLISISLNDEIQVSAEEAANSFTNIIALSRCFIETRKNHPDFESPTKFYFNTLERALEKRKAENKLYNALDADLSLIKEVTNPCINLSLVK